jgi:hypothetical protein
MTQRGLDGIVADSGAESNNRDVSQSTFDRLLREYFANRGSASSRQLAKSPVVRASFWDTRFNFIEDFRRVQPTKASARRSGR